MFQKHIKNILQVSWTTRQCTYCCPWYKRNTSNYTCSMYIFKTSTP